MKRRLSSPAAMNSRRFRFPRRSRFFASRTARAGGPRAACPAGFTLIELLVAVALMAVLSILGWRGLDSVLRGRDHIAQTSDSLRALTVAFTQLDDDLRRSWPVRLLGTGAQPIGFAIDFPDDAPALHLLREMPPDTGVAQVQRVVWRVHRGVLERGFGVYTLPTSEGQLAMAPMTWQPLMAGISGWSVRAWVPGRGWLPSSGLLNPDANPPTTGTGTGAASITGVEVALDQANGERVVRIFSVQD